MPWCARSLLVALAVGVLLAGCGGEPESAAPSTSATPSRTPSESATPSESSTPSPSATGTPLPPSPDRVSLPALMREDLHAGSIRRLRQVAVTDAYRRYDVTYGSDSLRISGVLLVPHGKGPFPAVVLNHGYIEPSVYVTGQGLAREQDRLARAGFVVLHTDYRGHAGSDPSGQVARETRLGYTRDTINAVVALKRERYVDRDRVAMLGRSMGGGVTLNALVVRPGLVKAAVVFAPVSSSFVDNFDRWTRPERPAAAKAFIDRFGGPRRSPDFWSGLSSRTYFDRISVPVLIHHGTSDDQCPIRWSRTTQRLLQKAGVESTLRIYQGEEHAFIPQWPLSMDRTIRFLRKNMPA